MNTTVSKRLELLRKQHDLTQEALAEKIGVSRQAVSSWEQGNTSPDPDNLIALARLYGVKVDELLEDPEIQDGFKQRREAFFDVETDSIPIKPKRSRAANFPFPVVAVLAYFIIAFTTGAWHPTWLIFLSIPLYYSIVYLVEKVQGKSDRHWMDIFPYPIIVVAAFLLTGFYVGYWHIIWVMFLTIPVYYIILSAVKNKRKGWRAILIGTYPLLVTIVFLLLGFLADAWSWAWLVFLTIPIWAWMMKALDDGKKENVSYTSEKL